MIPASQNDQAPEDAHCQSIVSTIFVDNSHGLCHLSNVPVQFGDFGKAPPPASRPLLNNTFPCYAQQVLCFSWAVYSFQGGHFASTIQSQNLPFCVSIACNPYEAGCSLFQEFMSCRHIFSSANDMLHYIRASGDTSVIHGNLIHSPCFQTSKRTTTFCWGLYLIEHIVRLESQESKFLGNSNSEMMGATHQVLFCISPCFSPHSS